MSAPFAPGPWEPFRFNVSSLNTVKGRDGRYRTLVIDKSATVVAEARGDTPADAEANARLIAAAPTMAGYIQRKADEGDAEAAAIMEAVHGRG